MINITNTTIQTPSPIIMLATMSFLSCQCDDTTAKLADEKLTNIQMIDINNNVIAAFKHLSLLIISLYKDSFGIGIDGRTAIKILAMEKKNEMLLYTKYIQIEIGLALT